MGRGPGSSGSLPSPTKFLLQDFFQVQKLPADLLEEGQDRVADLGKGGGRGLRQVPGAVILAHLVLELALHGRQGHLFFVAQALELEDKLDVGGAVQAVAGFAAGGAQDLPRLSQ